MAYLVATGLNIPLVDLDPIIPQPRSDGMRATRRSYSANGLVTESGYYVELIWSALGSAAQFQALLAQFGLDSALSAEVTVQIRTEMFTWIRMSGTAIRPAANSDVRWDYFPRQVTVLIRELETAL
jgi:hypothetical protein